jgi:hypothetical protein
VSQVAAPHSLFVVVAVDFQELAERISCQADIPKAPNAYARIRPRSNLALTGAGDESAQRFHEKSSPVLGDH